MHSAKCDVVIPGEEPLSSILYKEFVAFPESAGKYSFAFQARLIWLSNVFTLLLPIARFPYFFLSFFSVYFVVRFQIPTFVGRAINSLSL